MTSHFTAPVANMPILDASVRDRPVGRRRFEELRRTAVTLSAGGEVKPIEVAFDELAAAGPEIHCGDSHAALWRLHDCLAAILTHLDPELIDPRVIRPARPAARTRRHSPAVPRSSV